MESSSDRRWCFAADAPADEVRVRVAGAIDRTATDEVHQRFLDTLVAYPAGSIVVDLAELSFLDSSAIRMLLTWRHLADERERPFRVQRAQGFVARLLEVTGTGGTLGVED